MRRVLSMILIVMVCLGIMVTPIFADVDRAHQGNDLIIRDEASLFTSKEERALSEQLRVLCKYGDAIVYTMDYNLGSTYSAADNILRSYGNDGVAFLIDMDNREIYLYTTYDALSVGKCYSITDNVYQYATDGEYYQCASVALEQTIAVLKGQRIAEPMKYINNALLSIIMAMLMTFTILLITSRKKKASAYEVARGSQSDVNVKNSRLTVTGTHRIRHQSSSGGSGGGSSGGGGGHGGGHSF